MKKHLQDGSAHVVLFVLIFIVIIGALGWVFYQNFMSDSDETETAQTTTSTQAGSLKIDEFKVELPLESAVFNDDGVGYTIDNNVLYLYSNSIVNQYISEVKSGKAKGIDVSGKSVEEVAKEACYQSVVVYYGDKSDKSTAVSPEAGKDIQIDAEQEPSCDGYSAEVYNKLTTFHAWVRNTLATQ